MSVLEQEWKQYPVLYLDLNTELYGTKEALENKLNLFLANLEDVYGKNSNERTLGTRFEGIIRRIYEKSGDQVVILVDEYDKPMLQAIDNAELQTAYRNMLKAFYGALKSCDRYIRFAFLTGVTKFGKVSVFSDLNNLEDLSFLPQYSTICGISEEELYHYFDEGVQELADSNSMTKEICYAHLKRDFDGYHFCWNGPGMYNPFSLFNTLKNKTFRDYWFETGTPSFLVYQLQKTGYLLDAMTEGFMRRLQAFFANGDYQVMGNREIYLQNTLYVIFRMLGFYVEVERHTTDGRMDILVQTPQYIYILELRLDQSAEIALSQIEEKGYAKPLEHDNRKLFKVGINFSTKTKLIDDWCVVERS